jgi:sugar O-acyltransferase (sialic acid O-acetyltransferase NeuD family)
MSGPLILFGCGGHAKVLLEAIRARSPDRQVAIVDDRPGGEVFGIAVSGTREWLASNLPGVPVALGIGGNAARFAIIEWLAAQSRPLETIVHPSAIVGATVSLAPGAFVAAGAVLIADAKIGRGAIVNTAASVDHDCIVGEAAHIAPGARLCGDVHVGARTLIGVGSSVAPGVSIGPDAIIGAGSTVVRDLAGSATYVGCPAKLAKTL